MPSALGAQGGGLSPDTRVREGVLKLSAGQAGREALLVHAREMPTRQRDQKSLEAREEPPHDDN